MILTLSSNRLSAPWLTRLNWDELTALLICLSFDIIEYPLPRLMAPFSGDILDLIGVAFTVYLFGVTGFVALIELIPGVDILPTFTVTWLLWYSLKRRSAQIETDDKLEKWK